jgi:mono/diheme cytochrome c family protein
MRSVMKWTVRAVLALIVLVGGIVAVAFAYSSHLMNRRLSLPIVALSDVSDATTLARGAYLARTRGCGDCHGSDFAGRLAIDAGPVGRIYAPNLTLGGTLRDYDVARFEHAVRHAVGADGRPLLVMPSRDYAQLADSDVVALYAYLRALPSLDVVQPRSTIGVLGRVLYLFGQFDLMPADGIDHALASAPKSLPDAAASVETGRYVAQTCIGCHGTGFAGGHVPGTPPSFADAANLTPDATGLAGWREADFFRAMREGKRPDGSAIDPFMPWRSLGAMDDAELHALWAYLSTLPAKARGTR